ncbi:MAG: DUF1573 domain-containing protein [Tenuifilaceae bacterium]
MKRYFSFLSLIFVLSLFYSCGNSSSPNTSTVEGAAKKAVEDSYADLKLIDDFFDFGSIIQGEVVSHTFRFQNIGSDVLIIKDLVPDCGCTKPKVDKTVVKPGEEGTIEVIFNSAGWRGSQYKSVTLRTNSPIREKAVTIKANVVPPKE